MLSFSVPPTFWRGQHDYKKGPAEGLTTICLSGWATSVPPACLTNSAGERKLPWHTHIILTSSPFPYLYKIPSILLPLGPSPSVKTHGMLSTEFDLVCLPRLSKTSGFFGGLSVSVTDVFVFFLPFVPEEPIASWLLRSCRDRMLERLASPQLLDPVMQKCEDQIEKMN